MNFGYDEQGHHGTCQWMGWRLEDDVFCLLRRALSEK
jgi:hypothetical protein